MANTVELRGSLDEFVQCFDECVEEFYREPHLSPPFQRSSDQFRKGNCLSFHREAIRYIRQRPEPFSQWLPTDRRCHELLYSVLTAWGMNQLGAKLKDFEEFQRAVCFLSSIESLEKCRALHLDLLTHKQRFLIEDLFEALADSGKAKIMKSGAFVVGGSKLLHHLLPDLIPPIDNKYTWGLIGWLNDGSCPRDSLENIETVWSILAFFRKVVSAIGTECIRRKWLGDQGKYPMNTSIPKVIDNALISYYWRLWPDSD